MIAHGVVAEANLVRIDPVRVAAARLPGARTGVPRLTRAEGIAACGRATRSGGRPRRLGSAGTATAGAGERDDP